MINKDTEQEVEMVTDVFLNEMSKNIFATKRSEKHKNVVESRHVRDTSLHIGGCFFPFTVLPLRNEPTWPKTKK